MEFEEVGKSKVVIEQAMKKKSEKVATFVLDRINQRSNSYAESMTSLSSTMLIIINCYTTTSEVSRLLIELETLPIFRI